MAASTKQIDTSSQKLNTAATQIARAADVLAKAADSRSTSPPTAAAGAGQRRSASPTTYQKRQDQQTQQPSTQSDGWAISKSARKRQNRLLQDLIDQGQLNFESVKAFTQRK
jgi:hypothetical protein